MTRFTVGNARRKARSISSTCSCTLITLIDGEARQWKLTISPASVSRTRTLWMSWMAPSAGNTGNGVLVGLTASGLMGDVGGGGQRHVAVDLEVDAHGEPAAEIVHGDVVDGEAGIARDHHDALANALIVARHRHRGEGKVGIVEHAPNRLLRPALDLLD